MKASQKKWSLFPSAPLGPLALALCGAAPLVLVPSSLAEPPAMISYQGRVDVSGTAFSGTGHFRFMLIDGVRNQILWSHDGTSVAGGAPATPVDLPVVAGLYSVRLGDTNVAGITMPLSSDVFAQHSDVRLRVWFDDGTHGLQQLSPDARLSSVGFALAAEQLTGQIAARNVPPGIIDSTSLADSAVTSGKIVDGAVTAGKLMDGVVTGSKIAGGTIEPTHLNPAYGLWKKGPGGLSYDEGGVDIGTGGNRGIAPLHVTSGPAYLNSVFESSSPTGTWLTLGNSSPQGTNWTFATAGADAAAAGDVGILVIAPTSGRVNKGPSVLTLAPTSRVGVNTSHPLAPLHVQSPKGDGNLLLLGSAQGESGKSSLALGLTAAAGGTPFIQGVSLGGSSYGTLKLNNSGGNVDIAQGGSTLLSASGGGVGIGLGSNLPTAGLQVDSLGGWVNSIFDSSSPVGTWLTLRNSSEGSTNWVIADAGASTARDVQRGSLVIAPSPSRGNLGNPALVVTPPGKVGVQMRNPSAPLHVSAPSSGGAALRVGGDPTVIGTTLVDVGMTTPNNGRPYIQGVKSSGQNYGELYLNPYGGQVQVGDFSRFDSGSTLSVFQQPSADRCVRFYDASGSPVVSIGEKSFALKVAGEAYKNNGSPFWNTTSDRRLKTDVATLGDALALVDRVRPVTYRYSAEHRAKNPGIPATIQYGVVAQEFAEVFADFVTADKDGFLSVNSSPLVFANTAAIQELHAKVASRDARIQALESRNEELQHELSRLKKSCAAVASLSDRLAALEKQLAVVPPAAGAQWAANR